MNLVFQELSFTASQQSLNIYVSKPVLTKTWTPKLLLESLKNNRILPNQRAILWHTFNSKYDFLLLKFQSSPFFVERQIPKGAISPLLCLAAQTF